MTGSSRSPPAPGAPRSSGRSTPASASAARGRLRGSGSSSLASLIAAPAGSRGSCRPPPAGAVPTIVDLVPAADWDEREAHDLYGLRFAGHEPLRPLVDHTAVPAWMTPVSGDGVHQVAVGPIHAGVIESGHFRFHVVGERILALDPRLFYKHRGLERAAEGHDADGAARLRPARLRRVRGGEHARLCAGGRGGARAGARPRAARRPHRAARARAHLQPPPRHLPRSAPASASRPARWRSPRSRTAPSRSTRARSGTASCSARSRSARRGGARPAATHDAPRAARDLRADAAAAWRELEFAGSVQARLDGVGVLAREDALRLGAVGPAARAAGLREDVRDLRARASAYDGLRCPPRRRSGRRRRRARAAEDRAPSSSRSRASCSTSCSQHPLARGRAPTGTHAAGAEPASATRRRRVESPRGATPAPSSSTADRSRACTCAPRSYANWPALAHAAPGNLLPDFPLINKSFELCYACVDR